MPEARPYIYAFQDVPMGTVLRVTEKCFAYNVFDSEHLREAGVFSCIVESLTKENYVRSAIDKSVFVPKIGVRGFDLLNKICDDLDIDKSSIFSDEANLSLELRDKVIAEVTHRMQDPIFSKFNDIGE